MHEKKTNTLISKITKHFNAFKEQTCERYRASDIQDASLRYTLCGVTVGIPIVFCSFSNIHSPTDEVKKIYIEGYGRVMKESVNRYILLHLLA